jgi:hypothetical protein
MPAELGDGSIGRWKRGEMGRIDSIFHLVLETLA